MKNHEIDFFTQSDINLLKKWANVIYDKDNVIHKKAADQLQKTVWAKTVHWCDKVIKKINDYDSLASYRWSKRGWADSNGTMIRVSRFKPYTWARIYKKDTANKFVFFTIGVDSEEKALVYKIDYYAHDNKLSKEQMELCQQLIPDEVSWLTVNYQEIPDFNWEKLVDLTVTFIKENVGIYDNIVKSVGTGKIKVPKLKNRLIKRTLSKGGYDSVPSRNFSFKGHDTNWGEKQKQNEEKGQIGEELVIGYEIDQLRKNGRKDLIKYVHKVKDGNGFDIESRNLDETIKYIEVKTTTGDENAMFSITDNEVAFSDKFQKSYSLYRLFNLDKENRVAEFHEYKGNVRQHFLFEGSNFNAYRKSKL